MPRAVSNVDFKLEDINRSGRGIQGERGGEGKGEREKGGERKRGRGGEGERERGRRGGNSHKTNCHGEGRGTGRKIK